MAADSPFEIAIVGGGIVGVTLAAGLVHRGVKVKLFEQARGFREIGVGIGFTANTVRCMRQINPVVVESLREGGAVPNGAFRYLDGYFTDPNDADNQKRLCMLDAGPMGWETVRRDMFLLELVKRLPEEIFRLSSRLVDVKQEGEDGKVVMKFEDGNIEEVDALISCDGLRSKTRQVLLGADHPASYPQYTHKVAYRTLVPKEKVLEAIGEYKTERLHFHLGPGAHLLHYPVNSKMIGSAVYVHDPEDWPDGAPLTAQGKREDVLKAVEGWSEPVTKLVNLFPENLEKWALFDMFEYPLNQYNFGRIALAGDAAHASSPHHGAGASFGIEDVLCLCTLLDQATAKLKSSNIDKNMALKLAFETYDEVRRGRTQWLVNSARRTCELYQQPEWGDPIRKVKAETCFEEVKDRSFKVWHFNSVAMVKETIDNYKQRLAKAGRNIDVQPTTIRTSPSTNGQLQDGSNVSEKPMPSEIDWLVHIPDHDDMLSARMANLQSHMANTKEQVAKGKLVVAGPMLSAMDVWSPDQARRMTGSVQIIRASSEDEVLQVLLQDPFAKQGVWNLERVTLQPMRVGMAKA